MTQAHEAQALSPGAVVVRAGQPLRLLAVVHKLDETPSWREEWVARALDAVFREAGRRGLGALALPVLGGVHGKLDAARFWTLLKASIEATTSRPARIWLIR